MSTTASAPTTNERLLAWIAGASGALGLVLSAAVAGALGIGLAAIAAIVVGARRHVLSLARAASIVSRTTPLEWTPGP